MSWCWICWRRLAGISIPVCENRQSTALPAWPGILTYASMLRSPARRAPCILPVLTNRRGEGADRQAEAFDYFIYNAGSKDGVIDGGLVIFASGNEYAAMPSYPGAFSQR